MKTLLTGLFLTSVALGGTACDVRERVLEHIGVGSDAGPCAPSPTQPRQGPQTHPIAPNYLWMPASSSFESKTSEFDPDDCKNLVPPWGGRGDDDGPKQRLSCRLPMNVQGL